MIALFDIGNSRIKWAQFDPDANLDQLQLYNTGSANYAESTISDIGTANWSTWPKPEAVIVSAVAADKHWLELSDWCARHWQLKSVRVTSIAEQCGVRNAYALPEELGSDRWAAMVGAHFLSRSNTCIVDCGTAMTVDFLDASGQHLGGYIIPGLSLTRESLARGTHAIQLSSPLVGVDRVKDCKPAKSTADCIEQGVLMAAAGLIEKGCERIEASTSKAFACLLTGGNAEYLATCLDKKVRIKAELVLLGLAQIAIKMLESNSTNQR